MNRRERREARKALMTNRQTMEGADFVALTSSPESYLTEVRRLRDVTKDGSIGRFGMACPICYLEVAINGRPEKGQCRCPENQDSSHAEEALAALGFAGAKFHYADRRPI